MSTDRMDRRFEAARRRRLGSVAGAEALGAWIGFAGSIAFVGGFLADADAVAMAGTPAVLAGIVAEAAGWGGRRGAIRRSELERSAG